MTISNTRAHQEYRPFPFVLDEAKFRRLVDLCCRAISSSGKVQTKIDAIMKNNRTVTFSSLDDLLRVDNTVKGGIAHLKIGLEGLQCTEDGIVTERRVILIDIGNGRSHGGEPRVSIDVTSDSASWTQIAIAEIEEQLERIRQPSWPQLVGPIFLHSSYLVLMLFMLGMLISVPFESRSQMDVAKREILEAPSPSHEDKIDALYRLAQLQAFDKSAPAVGFTFSAATILLTLVAVALAVILWYIVRYCYPNAVFLWGDVVQYYQEVVERRRLLWSLIFGGLALGVVSSLVATIFSSHFSG